MIWMLRTYLETSLFIQHVGESCVLCFVRAYFHRKYAAFESYVTSISPSVPTLIHDTGKAVSVKEKAEVLSDFFGKFFTSSVSRLGFADLYTFGNTAQQCPDDFLCTVEEVEHLSPNHLVQMESHLRCLNLLLRASLLQ